jgi:hypothetical protein
MHTQTKSGLILSFKTREVKQIMKLKNIAYITAICVMIFSVLGTVVVFAPPQGPLLPAPIEVINPPDTTLAVTTPEGQSLDVTLDEPIEIVNPVGSTLDVTLDEPIDVILDEPIDVTLDEPIEIVNPVGGSLDVTLDEPIDVVITNTNSQMDITGWLHTTTSGNEDWNTFSLTANYDSVFIDTEGYREITVVFDSSQDAVDFGLAWTIDGQFRWVEGWTFGNEKPSPFTTPYGSSPTYFFKTYPVQGEMLEINWYAVSEVLSSGEHVSIAYYMTT